MSTSDGTTNMQPIFDFTTRVWECYGLP